MQNSRVRYLEFTRNFGKEAAITAGLRYAKGAAAIIIDSDLQHPPVLIPEFIKYWEGGVPMVVGLRTANDSSGIFRRLSSFFF
jgi:dolichol-phosphate mannosyltransferase